MIYREIPEPQQPMKMKYYGIIGLLKFISLLIKTILLFPLKILKFFWNFLITLWKEKFEIILSFRYFIAFLFFPISLFIHYIRKLGEQPDSIENICAWINKQWRDKSLNNNYREGLDSLAILYGIALLAVSWAVFIPN